MAIEFKYAVIEHDEYQIRRKHMTPETRANVIDRCIAAVEYSPADPFARLRARAHLTCGIATPEDFGITRY